METTLMDLAKARRLMHEKGIDVLVATSSTNFYYTSMFRSGLPEGAAMTITPAAPGIEPIMIVPQYDGLAAKGAVPIKDIRTFPNWIEMVELAELTEGKARKVPKPYQFNIKDIYVQVSNIFKEIGVHDGTIGIEMESLTHRDHSLLVEHNPKAKFVDAGPIFWDLRKIKSQGEIETLKTAAQITVEGVKGMIKKGVLGATITELHANFKQSLICALTSETARQFEFRVTPIAAGDPFTSRADRKVAMGDLIYIDCGIFMNGYMSDMGRNFVVGKRSSLQEKIYGSLRTGYEEALSIVRPGVKLKEIYHTAQETVRKSGLDFYSRGHLGHNIGLEFPPAKEHPPFIYADEETELEPNMVICIETPLVVKGLGSFQIEDMILVTEKGSEILTDMSRDLTQV